MSNKSKQRGTAAETAVVRAARTRGFPHADRLALTGNKDRGDVRLTTGLTAGVVIEVKGGQMARSHTDRMVEAWLDETAVAKSHTRADVSFLVVQRAGVGAPNAHRWHAYWRHQWLTALTGGPMVDPFPVGLVPVRLTLEHSLWMLRAHGYGEPLEAVVPDDAA